MARSHNSNGQALDIRTLLVVMVYVSDLWSRSADCQVAFHDTLWPMYTTAWTSSELLVYEIRV